MGREPHLILCYFVLLYFVNATGKRSDPRFAVACRFSPQVMPDVMTPESLVSKLDEFENPKEGNEEVTKEQLDVSDSACGGGGEQHGVRVASELFIPSFSPRFASPWTLTPLFLPARISLGVPSLD